MPEDAESTGETFDTTRRTVLKASGAAAGAGLLGAGLSGSAAADDVFRTRFANPRTQEAAKVWERGYRGRRDRTAGINDSGIDIDHPDLGGWNGVTAVGKDAERGGTPELLLTDPGELGARAEHRKQVGKTRSRSAVLGPGTTVEGSQTVVAEFTVPEGEGIIDMDATLSWQPSNVPLPGIVPILSSVGEDQSFSAQLNVGTADDPEWVTLQTVDTGSNPEKLKNITVVPGEQHRFVAGQFANVVSEGTVEWEYYTYTDDTLSVGGTSVSFDAKTVGWFDAGARYGSLDAPDDPDGHGSHVSGIVAGTGQASTIGDATYDDPRAVLTAGDTLTYEVEARAGTGVFGVATGEGIEVLIESPDGRTLRGSGAAPFVGGEKEALPVDDARVDHPTVHDSGTATYMVVVRASGGEAASTGQVEEVTVGAFAVPGDTTGAAVPGTDAGSAEPALNTGMAPNAGLVGLQGLSGPAAALGLYGEQMAAKFNMRTVNMSWGGLVPGGGTIGGGGIQRAIKKAAQAGILTCAAAGNNFGTVNSAPAIADEAVSVAATNYVDGVTSYTDGGTRAQDEDGGTYGKPDVCAPGGSLEAGARSVRASAESEAGYDRDYVNFAGTSMASPYTTGTATLVAEAMDEEYGDAPDSISLPAPADTGFDDVMRLKQVLLATASKVTFTAAPYHRHATRYVHDGRTTYQGYGRVNPDAAVDAVTRDLFDGSDEGGLDTTSAPTRTPLETDDDGSATAAVSLSGPVGLDVPADPRAVAGYVEAKGGTLDVSLEFSHYAGGNKGMTKGDPHVDLFVYDGETPSAHGEPNTLASAQGTQGSASVSVDLPSREFESDEPNTRTLFVVAKLVNVPGVVNGFDVQAYLDLDLTFTAADVPEKTVTTDFTASGSRSDDGSTFTGGQSNKVDITLQSVENADEVRVTDQVPDGWTVDESFGDVERVDGNTVVLGTVPAEAVSGNGTVTRTYFAEAPSGAENTDRYTFGPAEAEVTDPALNGGDDDGDYENGGRTDAFAGTDTNYVVGPNSQL